MPFRKTKEAPKKLVLLQEHNQDQKQLRPGGWDDSDRLSGEGAESAMEHLRIFEQQRRDKAPKDEG